MSSPHAREELLTWVANIVARALGMSPAQIRSDERLERYGVDSLQWANIAYEISFKAGRRMSPEEAAACGTLAMLAQSIRE